MRARYSWGIAAALLIAIGFASYAHYLRFLRSRFAAEWRAINELNNGKYRSDFSIESEMRSDAPPWCERFVPWAKDDRTFVTTAVQVSAHDPEFRFDYRDLYAFQKLRCLRLMDCDVRTADLLTLAALKELQSIDFVGEANFELGSLAAFHRVRPDVEILDQHHPVFSHGFAPMEREWNRHWATAR